MPHDSRMARALLLGSVAACTITAAMPCSAATPPGVEPRILAQEGLAIALASTVLQSQLEVLLFDRGPVNYCKPQPDGHSVENTRLVTVSPSVTDTDVTIFFDNACKKPYVEVSATVTQSARSATVTETAAYVGVHGQALGSLALTETLTQASKNGVVIGIGTFSPANGAHKVSLGLTCIIPAKTGPFDCQGGIAQTFTALNLSLASVTPLTMTPMVKSDGSIGSFTFGGAASTLKTGAPGALSIVKATPSTLGIAGTATSDGSVVTQGKAAAFTLFPPIPTAWTITDAPRDTIFSLSVVSNATKASQATVKSIATGAVLATLSMDQSGTGAVAYAGGKKQTITSWLLAD